MFQVVLVGLSPRGLRFLSCWLVYRMEGYVFHRVGWLVCRLVFVPFN